MLKARQAVPETKKCVNDFQISVNAQYVLLFPRTVGIDKVFLETKYFNT